MNEIVLKLTDVTKKYGSFTALDHMNLSIEKGKTYGFIGQNGAGKTTIIRQVCGLSYPDEGTVALFGRSDEKGLRKGRARMGCMVETPALYPGMAAYGNMETQRLQRGIPDKSVIVKTLEMVGLMDTDKKTVKHFSLGMKQRLGIAISVDDVPKAAALLEEKLHTTHFQVMPDKTIRLYDYLEDVRAVSEMLSVLGLIIMEISVKGDSLEDYFISLIGGIKNA